MNVKNLGHTPLADIIACFLEAFDGYFVELPKEPSYYEKRWKNAKVWFELSFGMFDEDRLVGFILNGIDHRMGEYIAYNAGTGIIPAYRGKRIVKAIYDEALPELRKNGITLCTLEVIKENIAAIKAYESCGFSIAKSYLCFNGELHSSAPSDIQLQQQKLSKVNWDQLPNQEYYSWDYHRNSLSGEDFSFFKVVFEETEVGYFIINNAQTHLAQLDVFEDKLETWNALFTGISSLATEVKIINVDECQQEKVAQLLAHNLKNNIDQYEMKLKF